MSEPSLLPTVLCPVPPSGRFSVLRAPWLLVGAAAGGAVGAAIALVLEVLGAAIWLAFGALGASCNALLLFAMLVWVAAPGLVGFALGMGARMAVRRARCRASWVVSAAALAAAVPAAVGWGLLHLEAYRWLTEVGPLADWVAAPVSGLGAFLVAALAPVGGIGAATDDPFCEACGDYVDPTVSVGFDAAATRPVLADLEADRAPAAARLPAREAPARLQLLVCPCRQLCLLKLQGPAAAGRAEPVRTVFFARVTAEDAERWSRELGVPAT